MAASKSTLTAERLRTILAYDPATGLFTRNHDVGGYKAGGIAGSKNKRGYINISIDGMIYCAHRLAFLYVDGVMPSGSVDHINMVKDDNRWSNLRDVDARTNRENMREAMLTNCSSGVLGAP